MAEIKCKVVWVVRTKDLDKSEGYETLNLMVLVMSVESAELWLITRSLRSTRPRGNGIGNWMEMRLEARRALKGEGPQHVGFWPIRFRGWAWLALWMFPPKI